MRTRTNRNFIEGINLFLMISSIKSYVTGLIVVVHIFDLKIFVLLLFDSLRSIKGKHPKFSLWKFFLKYLLHLKWIKGT